MGEEKTSMERYDVPNFAVEEPFFLIFAERYVHVTHSHARSHLRLLCRNDDKAMLLTFAFNFSRK